MYGQDSGDRNGSLVRVCLVSGTRDAACRQLLPRSVMVDVLPDLSRDATAAKDR